MDDIVARTGCSYAIRDEEASEGDVWIVDEVPVVGGESPVGEELFETLFEGLCRIGVFDFTEEYGVESFVGLGVVDLDDDVGTTTV